MVTTPEDISALNLWDAPWAPSPEQYVADLRLAGRPAEPDDVEPSEPDTARATRRSREAVIAAILNATGAEVDLWDEPLPDRPSDAYSYTDEDGDDLTASREGAASEPIDIPARIASDYLSRLRITAEDAAKAQRNARDRARRLNQWTQRVRSGDRPHGPPPRGR